MNQQLHIILASASPRRAELLKQIGWLPEIHPVDIDESVQPGEEASAYCVRMALEKMAAASQSYRGEWPVLTADTIVAKDGEILGKPGDEKAAELTLIKLSDSTHQVYSAVAISYQGQLLHRLSQSDVLMAPMSEAEIKSYVASGEPMDKAGAYGIQGLAAQWVANIHGSYSSIMGLPLYETSCMLKALKCVD